MSETQDNEKNNGNTQVADTAKENSTEKKDKRTAANTEDVQLYHPQTGEQSRQNVQAAQPYRI